MTDGARIRSIAVVGNGASGWLVAAMLAKRLAGHVDTIIVLELPHTKGGNAVGLSPASRAFHKMLGISEKRLETACSATPKLGIAYQDWLRPNSDGLFVYGRCGQMIDGVEFHHFLSRLRAQGRQLQPTDYSIAAHVIDQGQFAPDSLSAGQDVPYGWHMDLSAYGESMKKLATAMAVETVPGHVAEVEIDPNTGQITSLNLTDGRRIDADYYFDCSGSEAQLMTALGVSYVDWAHWLPVNQRQYGDPQAVSQPLVTQIQPEHSGWKQLLPLDQRVGSVVTSAELATDGRSVCPLRPGHQAAFQVGNCTAIGSAAGYPGDLVVDPLQLTQSAVLRWLDWMPGRVPNPHLAEQYNRATTQEYDRVRDVHLLHLHQAAQTRSAVSEFWNQIYQVELPDTLRYRRELFEETGKWAFYEGESVSKEAWIAIMLALEIWPTRYDRLAQSVAPEALLSHLDELAENCRSAAVS